MCLKIDSCRFIFHTKTYIFLKWVESPKTIEWSLLSKHSPTFFFMFLRKLKFCTIFKVCKILIRMVLSGFSSKLTLTQFLLNFNQTLIIVLGIMFLLHSFNFQVVNGEPLKVLELGRDRGVFSDVTLVALFVTK